MLNLPQRAAQMGFLEEEFTRGVSPSARRRSLLDSYLMNMRHGPAVIHEMMIADLRRWIDLGALSRAADVAIVLRQFVSDYPQVAFPLGPVDRRDAEWGSRAWTRRAHSSRVVISLAGRLRSARAPGAECPP